MNEIQKLKKAVIGSAIVAGVLTSCSGCSKSQKLEVKEPVTTEITTEEEKNIEEVVINNYEQLAESSYNEYKDFYNKIGLELDDVVKVVKFINDDTQSMTDDEIIETSTNIRKILYSDQLQSTIRIANEGLISEEVALETPSLVPFVEDVEIKQELTQFETLRNKVSKEAYSGLISESTKQEVKDFAIQTHLDAYNNNYAIYEQEDSLGQCYVQNEWREQIFNLVVVVTNESEITNDKLKGHMMQIAPKTVEESDLLNLYIVYGNEMPDDKKVEVLELRNKLPGTKFSDLNTNILNKMISYPEVTKECILDSSKQELIDSYKIKKAILEAYNLDTNVYTLNI